MSSMAKVKVFYDGTYEIEEVNDNAATQRLYIAEKGKFGEAMICEKEDIEKYKNELAYGMIGKNSYEIIELQNQNDKLGKLLLTNIDWYGIIHISVGGRIWTIKFYKKKNIPVKVLNGF